MPDTIAAIATASAAAAVGIVRLSGAETRHVLAALFTPVNGRFSFANGNGIRKQKTGCTHRASRSLGNP